MGTPPNHVLTSNPGLHFGFLFVCLALFGPEHAEVSGSGIEPAQQLRLESQQWQPWIFNLMSQQGIPILRVFYVKIQAKLKYGAFSL